MIILSLYYPHSIFLSLSLYNFVKLPEIVFTQVFGRDCFLLYRRGSISFLKWKKDSDNINFVWKNRRVHSRITFYNKYNLHWFIWTFLLHKKLLNSLILVKEADADGKKHVISISDSVLHIKLFTIKRLQEKYLKTDLYVNANFFCVCD